MGKGGTLSAEGNCALSWLLEEGLTRMAQRKEEDVRMAGPPIAKDGSGRTLRKVPAFVQEGAKAHVSSMESPRVSCLLCPRSSPPPPAMSKPEFSGCVHVKPGWPFPHEQILQIKEALANSSMCLRRL